MKKIITLPLLFFVAINTIAAQGKYVDSLRHELSIAGEDTNKVRTLENLSFYYAWSFPDSSLFYSSQGLKLAEKLKDVVGQIRILITIGFASVTKGDYVHALESELKSVKIAEQLKDPELISLSYRTTGMIYLFSGDYQNALNYYLKVKARIPTQEKLFKDVQLLEFIGEAYLGLNQIDSAFLYSQESYKSGIAYKTYFDRTYFSLGKIYAIKGQYNRALDYYRTGIGLQNFLINTINGYSGIATVFDKLGHEDSAVYYAQKVISDVRLTSQVAQVVQAASLLTKIYTAKNLTDSALKYQSIEVAAKDSLFSQEKVREFQNISFNEKVHQQELAAASLNYKNRLRMYVLTGGLLALILLALILFRNNTNKLKANILLGKQKEEIQSTLAELKSTQKQLIQSEKMASLGELTAGIAHEIQNPLNFVNNFSDVNKELIDELVGEVDKGNTAEVKAIANDIKENSEKINHHGRRADAIVKGMLQHSRSSTGVTEPTDINALCDEYLRLSYHGMRAKDKSFNVTMKTDFDESIGKINIVPQDIGRVLLNLINNAFYAVNERKKSGISGYEPIVTVSTRKSSNQVTITVTDNGNGIPDKIKDKIFQPFFTTKPTGEGTGLGLSLSYDMVRANGGELKVESKENEGTEFVIQLPD